MKCENEDCVACVKGKCCDMTAIANGCYKIIQTEQKQNKKTPAWILATIYWGLLILSVSALFFIYSMVTERMISILSLITIWIVFYLVIKCQ